MPPLQRRCRASPQSYLQAGADSSAEAVSLLACVDVDMYIVLVFIGVVSLGAVNKLRLQEEVGRWSKNVHFCQQLEGRTCQRRVVGGQKKPKSCQRSL